MQLNVDGDEAVHVPFCKQGFGMQISWEMLIVSERLASVNDG